MTAIVEAETKLINKRSHGSFPLKSILTITLLLAGTVLMVAPFIWIIQLAFTSDVSQVYKTPPRWMPVDPTMDNFAETFDRVPFDRFFFNSLKIASAITIGQLITCSTAAFAFARLHFPGRDVLFIFLLSGLMIPIQVTIVPLFILMRELGLYDTHWALILPPLANPFGVFLLRQYIMTLPTELDEAARIDGANTFTIFWRIILPLIGPALVTLAILAFVFWWNDFLFPLIMISTPELQTLPVGLTILRGRYDSGSLSVVAAGITMAVVPVLLVFLLLQRYIIKSIATTGLKG
jgi:multiple sugar transport system permease protein